MKASVLLTILVATTQLSAQTGYRYQRSVEPTAEAGWHSIRLPDEIFKRLNSDLTDIRLYAITGSDTTEIPYVIAMTEQTATTRELSLPMLNRSRKDGRHYFTFEMNGGKANHLDLEFSTRNFFAYGQVEGSHDQVNWFTLGSRQRLVSIQNENADLALTMLDFPLSDYKYLRISVEADNTPGLVGATLTRQETTNGDYHMLASTFHAVDNKQRHETLLTIRAATRVPVSHINVEATHSLDFYRNYSLEYLVDSTRTEKGWVRNYQYHGDGYLTSFRPNVIELPSLITSEFRITIRNQDNTPVAITKAELRGPDVTVITPLSKNPVVMYYGKRNAQAPSYDLTYFRDKIPANGSPANLGAEQEIVVAASTVGPLLQSNLWIWGAIVAVVLLLGFFTMKMMRSQSA